MLDLSALKRKLDIEIARGHAVVFVAKLDQLQNFEPLLTAAERTKHDKVRLSDQRRLHALGRGLVRYFLDLPPIDFTVGTAGKLGFAGAASFNISHAGCSIAVALHQRHAVGVDIETRQRNVCDDALIARVCHPQETHWITQQKTRGRTQAFLRCWVRKEAILKARGTGLVDDLQTINTCLQDRFAVVPGPTDLRLWDFPSEFSAEPGALATTSDVTAVSYLSPAMITSQQWGMPPTDQAGTSTNDEFCDDYCN